MRNHCLHGNIEMRAFSARNRAARRLRETFQKLDRHRDVRVNCLDREREYFQKEFSSFGYGMTNMKAYLSCEPRSLPVWLSSDKMMFPPCCIENAAINQTACRYFPCRKRRNVNQFRRTSQKTRNSFDIITNDRFQYKTEEGLSNELFGRTANTRTISGSSKYVRYFDLSSKERRLKQIVYERKLANERENKPNDRNLYYGEPSSVRRLHQPIRPVMIKESPVSLTKW